MSVSNSIIIIAREKALVSLSISVVFSLQARLKLERGDAILWSVIIILFKQKLAIYLASKGSFTSRLTH